MFATIAQTDSEVCQFTFALFKDADAGLRVRQSEYHPYNHRYKRQRRMKAAKIKTK